MKQKTSYVSWIGCVLGTVFDITEPFIILKVRLLNVQECGRYVMLFTLETKICENIPTHKNYLGKQHIYFLV